MNKIEWEQVKAVILDLDGTLYNQKRLRFVMSIKLIIHCLTSLRGLRDLRIIRHYRANREKLSASRVRNPAQIQFSATAEAFATSRDEIAAILHEWFEVKPLQYLKKYRYDNVADFISIMRSSGIKVAVFSDYPVKEKLKALELDVDFSCCATDNDINRLKPEPAGLIKVMGAFKLPAAHCLMIGDRTDRDGACADNVNMKFILREGDDFFARLIDDYNRGAV